MSLMKSGLSMVVGGLIAGAAATASAQQVESAKVQQYSLLPNAYGSVELRHYTMKELNEEKGDNANPGVQARTYLGSTFMDGKLDLTAVLAATLKPQTEKAKQRRPELDSKYTLLDGKYGEISPYLNVWAATEGHPVESNPGLYTQVKAPIETGIGTLTASLSGDWSSKVASQTGDAVVETEQGADPKSFGLAEDGTRTDGKQDLDFAAEYAAALNLKSGAIGVELSQWLDQVYNPRYVAQADGSVEVSRPVKTTTSERIKLSYKISDKTTLSDEVWYQQGGTFETQMDGYDDNKANPSMINIAKVAYTL